MPDKKILFTTYASYDVLPAKVTYEPGQIETMREDLANRWITRGVATDDAGAIAAAEAAKAPPPVPEVVEPAAATVAPIPTAADNPLSPRGRRSAT